MIEMIKNFNRRVSLERFISHSTNSNIQIAELSEVNPTKENTWICGEIWGNDDIKGLITVKFSTLNVLAMSRPAFENTKDHLLFEYTKDFMKEYCNFYGGFIKGTFNNQNIDVRLSLPIISSSLSPTACFGGNCKQSHFDTWVLKSDGSFIIIESYIKVSDEFKKYDLNFLSIAKEKKEAKSNVDFF